MPSPTENDALLNNITMDCRKWWYPEGTWQVRFGKAEVDQTQHHDADEEPTQEAHEVQQAVDVSDKQLEQGHGVLLLQAPHIQTQKQEK